MSVSHASAECFHTESFQRVATSQRGMVLDMIKRLGATTRLEVYWELRTKNPDLEIERGDVSRAVCELMDGSKYGGNDKTPIVELEGLRACPMSKRRVNWICCREDAAGYQQELFA